MRRWLLLLFIVAAAVAFVVAPVYFIWPFRPQTERALAKQNPVRDQVGDAPVLVLLAEDGKSVRVFDRRLEGRTLELFQRPDSRELIDAETGSAWDFPGAATSGALAGKRLARIQPVKDYWSDWRKYHPEKGVYLPGDR